MQDILGSVRRSLVFRSTSGDDGGGGISGLVEKIGSSIRKSRIGLFSKPAVPALPPIEKTDAPQIRWRKGELVGCGAFGRVYMGMNLGSGELLAVKQVIELLNWDLVLDCFWTYVSIFTNSFSLFIVIGLNSSEQCFKRENTGVCFAFEKN